MSTPRNLALVLQALLFLGPLAGAQVTIDFDGLAPGAVITNQFAEVQFSSSAGNQNVALFAGAGNVLFSGPVGGPLNGVEDTYLDFTYPVNGLTLLAVQPNVAGVVARFQIFENGLLTAVEDLIGLGGSGNKPVDLSAYQNVTRLEIIDILVDPMENGIGWDDFTFTENTSPYVYCTAKINSAGCSPSISWSGTPSKSAGSGFIVSAANLIDGALGILIYSKFSAHQLPFQGGLLCVAPPVWRTSVQNSGGTPPCAGSISLDFNLWIAIGPDHQIFEGTMIWAQCWSRDIVDPTGTSLSDALAFVVGP